MYESPIWITSQVIIKDNTKDAAEDVNNGFVQAIQKAVNFHVDKIEIEKALKYDRDQYDKGYADALKDAQIASERRIQLAKSPGEPKKRKTYMEDFFEKFPNAPRDPDGGAPQVCPEKIYAGAKAGCDMHYASCSDCWNREMEG